MPLCAYRIVCCFVVWLTVSAVAAPATAADFFVAVDGDDSSEGTFDAPLASIAAAQERIAAMKARGKFTEPITVHIRAGVYRLQEPLRFSASDSGAEGKPITYRAYEDESVTLSGGLVVDGWVETQLDGRTLWRTRLDSAMFPDGLRELYVDGLRRPRAKSRKFVPAGMLRDEQQRPQGIVLRRDPRMDVARFARPTDLEVEQQVLWRHYVLPVTEVRVNEANQVEVALRDTPEWLSPAFAGFKSFGPTVLAGALELLDEAGEWYFNRETGDLFYMPLPGEGVGDVEIVVPQLERVLTVEGAGRDQRVEHLVFERLTFAEAAWTGPSQEGWWGYDPGYILRGHERKNGFSMSGVYVTNARKVRFHRNTFTRMGGIGLHMHIVDESEVVGNVFRDISAEGLGLGSVHKPDHAPTDMLVADNLFYRTGRQFRMTAALLTGKLLRAKIHHNHVRDVPYIGLNVNKLFGDNPPACGRISVRHNVIESTMGPTYDGGAFYTWMDGSSDGSHNEFSDNYIRGVFSPDSQGVYLDNDCRYWRVERNVIENTIGAWYLIKGSRHILRDNFTDNEHARRMALHEPADIVEENTVVDVEADWQKHPIARATVENAGLEPEYADLLDTLPMNRPNQPPTVDAGPDRKISLLDNVRLDAAVHDDRRPYNVVHHRWEKVSGPGDVSLFGQHERIVAIEAAFSEPGTYVLRLTADDMQSQAHDEVTVEVAPADKGEDLAAGLPDEAYTASASQNERVGPPKAFDGNPGSFWYPGFPGKGWLQVDLGRPVDIRRVEMTLRADEDHEHSRKDFEILASNDLEFKSFATIAQQGLDPDPNVGGVFSANFDGAGAKYRYVRWWKRQPYDGVLNELRVYGR